VSEKKGTIKVPYKSARAVEKEENPDVSGNHAGDNK